MLYYYDEGITMTSETTSETTGQKNITPPWWNKDEWIEHINLRDEDFLVLWDSDIEEIQHLKEYIEERIYEYKTGLEMEIHDYIENGIGEMKSSFLGSVMRHFSDTIQGKTLSENGSWS